MAQGQEVAGLGLTGGTEMRPLARYFNPCLVLDQHSKTRSDKLKIVDCDIKNETNSFCPNNSCWKF